MNNKDDYRCPGRKIFKCRPNKFSKIIASTLQPVIKLHRLGVHWKHRLRMNKLVADFITLWQNLRIKDLPNMSEIFLDMLSIKSIILVAVNGAQV